MVLLHPSNDLATATWIDLVSPTPDEISEVERVTGLDVPRAQEVREIESSSRLAFANGVYRLSAPVLTSGEDGSPVLTSVGFVLDAHRLVTARFAAIGSFDEAHAMCRAQRSATGEDAFLHVVEVVVDKSADALEHAGADCDALSRGIFGDHVTRSSELRTVLRQIGGVAHHSSQVRDSLLAIGRIAAFVTGGLVGAPPVNTERMRAIHADVVSLTEYESHLSAKLQFLLDATLGFINIEQNEIVKTLTVASVVGVPPVLVAGIYGMNFRVMPELGWAWGYPFALALIVVTSLLPLIWFKRRGWM